MGGVNAKCMDARMEYHPLGWKGMIEQYPLHGKKNFLPGILDSKLPLL